MTEKEQWIEYLKTAKVDTEERMACSNCEGIEYHKKLENGVWKCLWCSAEEIKL